MILRRVEFKGLTRFDGQPVGFDLDRLGPGLVALVGKNGEGKTTALEAVFAALYKSLPSYDGGSIYNQVRGRDAFVRATFDDGGREVLAEVKLNGEKRTAECILSIDGKPVTTGKGRDYDEQIARLFGSPEMVLASVFAAQNKAGNFLAMPKGERKELFAELLGLARTVALCERSRARLAAAERQATVARAALDALAYDQEAHDVARDDLANLTETVDLLDVDVREAQAEVDAWRERAAGALGAQAELQAAERAEQQAQAALDQARRRVEDEQHGFEHATERLQERIAALETATFLPESVRAAAAAHDPDQLRDAQTESRMAADECRRKLALAGDLREQLRARDARTAGVRAAANESRAGLRAALEAARQQAAPLDQAPCVKFGVWEPVGVGFELEQAHLSASCQLLAGARAALDRVVTIEAQLAEVDAGEAGALYDADDPDQRADIEARLAAIDEAAEAHALDDYLRDIANCDVLIRDAEQARGKVAAVAGHQAALDQARTDLAEVTSAGEAKLVALRASWADAIADANRATAAREQAAEAYQAVAGAAGKLREAEATHGERVGWLTEARAKLAAQVERVRALDEKAAAIESRRADCERLAAEQADWKTLADALGKDGIQALEIDAAGPTVSALVNDLLASCYGPRFSVRLDTLREKRDGGLAEDFELHVYDDGQERAAWQFSGGQKVIVGEALGLALAIFNAQRFGVSWGTLFRDETAGALDPEAAAAYVLMLRRAMAIGGFRNVVFVSHVEAVWEAADAIVRVEGGRIEEGREALPT